MKALTIRQPWASLIALGVKHIETRSWRAPQSLIGERIAIHAGHWTPRVGVFCGPIHAGPDGGYEYAMLRDGDGDRPWKLWSPEGWMILPLGAVVATATLADCLPMVSTGEEGAIRTLNVDPNETLWIVEPQTDGDADEGLPEWREVSDQLPYGQFEPGRWAWMLTNIEACDPIPAKGKQGLWNWTTP